CAHGGATFARFWLHNGMLNFSGAKMSKSLGNIETVHDLIAKHPPEALRYALLSAHYRQPLDWSDGLIEQATNTLDRLYGTLRDLAALEACGSSGVEVSKTIPVEVESPPQDDLNTPLALSVIASIASEARALRNELVHGGEPSARMSELHAVRAKLLGAGLALGLLQQDPAAWFSRGTDADDDARITALVQERSAAKKAKDFARADAIRKQLADEGIVLEDTPQGVRWKRA
ncbi:class I tRNA ligase family protein, partial [Acinetobacter baumannii]|uniref:CysS/YqeB C-terminal domain-containing protein n=1 Tax=Acinetobacter baumannii TaxID=470 RepID=UPI001EEF7D43